MTPEDLRHAAEILLAAADGKKIQKLYIPTNTWSDINLLDSKTIVFSEVNKYRVKPRMPRIGKVNKTTLRNTDVPETTNCQVTTTIYDAIELTPEVRQACIDAELLEEE